MNENQPYEQDLASIHRLMERSVKFISLSGVSGIVTGIYALIGAGAAYYLVQYPASPFESRAYLIQDRTIFIELISIALAVLVTSIVTILWLSSRKAKRVGAKVWDTTSQRLLLNLAIPLMTGGIFVLICLWNGYFEMVAASCLIFYGLALLNASSNLYDEVRYLGYCEIILGLGSAAVPGYSLIFWTFGFSVLHIIYGAAMYRKYDR